MMFTKGILYSYYTIISLYIQLTNILLVPVKMRNNDSAIKFLFPIMRYWYKLFAYFFIAIAKLSLFLLLVLGY